MQFSRTTIPIFTQLELFSRGEEYECELQSLFWRAQSPHFNINEPLWSVLETRVRNTFPLPTSVKNLEDVLQEERYSIPLETVKILYEPIPRSIAAVLKAKFGSTPY
jgi:hypothetical protein